MVTPKPRKRKKIDDSKISCGPQRVSNDEARARPEILAHLDNLPKPELLLNLGLFMEPRMMSRILFLDHVFKQILNVQGVVFDIGTRWGNTAVILQNLRSIYEPYNYQRKIVVFDTFAGLKGTGPLDGDFSGKDGWISVIEGYEQNLSSLMSAHERLQPLNHIPKFEVVKGDVSTTIPDYIKNNPETLISLAFFDVDLYKPTLDALDSIYPRLSKGSILVFDELNYRSTPGETLAILDFFDLKQVSIERFPYCSRVSYIKI